MAVQTILENYTQVVQFYVFNILVIVCCKDVYSVVYTNMSEIIKYILNIYLFAQVIMTSQACTQIASKSII